MATKKVEKAVPKAAKSKTPTQVVPPPTPEIKAVRADRIGKVELVEAISDKTGLIKKRAGDAVDVLLDTVVETLKAGGSVGLPGFGTLSVIETKARQGVRPGTSEKISIPAGKKIRFKIASTFKAELS